MTEPIFPTIYTGDTTPENNPIIDSSAIPELPVSYMSEAEVDTGLFQQMAQELQLMIDHAHVLYMKINGDQYIADGATSGHLVAYDWLKDTLGEDFQGISFESESLVEYETLNELVISSEHLEYKNYAFTLLNRLIETGLDTSFLPSQIRDLHDKNPGEVEVQWFGTGTTDAEQYWQGLSEINVDVFIQTLGEAAIYADNYLEIDSELLIRSYDATEGYSYAMYQDENQDQITQNMTEFVENWYPTKIQEGFYLQRLAEKIEKMKERPSILEIPVTKIIGTFELFHNFMNSHYATLSELYLQLHGVEILEAQKNQELRDLYIRFLNKANDLLGIGEHFEITALDVENLSLEELEELARSTIRAVNPAYLIADEFRHEYGEIVDISEDLQNLITALEVAFLIGGFFPAVGLFANLGDTIVSLSTGNIAGAMFNFVPFGKLLSGMGSLIRKVDNPSFLSKLPSAMQDRAKQSVENTKKLIKKLRDMIPRGGGKQPRKPDFDKKPKDASVQVQKPKPDSQHELDPITDLDGVYDNKIVEYKRGKVLFDNEYRSDVLPSVLYSQGVYSKRVATFVKEDITDKGQAIVESITEGTNLKYQDGSKGGPLPVVTLEEIQPIREIEFWLEGNGDPFFEDAAEKAIQELNQKYGKQGFTFSIHFNVSKPDWALG